MKKQLFCSVEVKFKFPHFTPDVKFFPIKYAKIYISYSGLSEKIEKIVWKKDFSDDEEISVVFEKILCEKKSIASVEFFDENEKSVKKFLLRSIFDSEKKEKISIAPEKNDTPFASVLYEILNIFDLNELFLDGRFSVIKNAVDSSCDFCLFNINKLSGELKGFSFPYGRIKSDYVLLPGEVYVSSKIEGGFYVYVNDFLSLPEKIETDSVKISGICPGYKEIFLLDDKKNIIASEEILIEEGKLIKFVFEKKNHEKNIKKLDFYPSEQEFLKCFKDEPEKKRFVLLFSEKLYQKKLNSLQACFNSGINDHDGNYSGEHINLFYDERGFWFCYANYKNLSSVNQSGQPSYNFKADGKMILPPDFVPDGYIYQKFNESSPGKKFLVLIYSFQNEKKITSLLSKAKFVKKLSDFDLSTKDGQMQISNFRKLPGTNHLFRSFHPYKDDKKNISDTSESRLESLWKLCEENKISCDINLSDDSLQSPTYGMPSFYEKIIENKKILYVTQLSYSVCYENPDSIVFAEGIKKIVEFINLNSGNFLIHCAIGTDRTGVVSAVLSLLCGASWRSVENDYCSSINMGLLEYRGPFCIRKSIQTLLALPEFDVNIDFKKLLKEHFVKSRVLSESQIDEFVKKVV